MSFVTGVVLQISSTEDFIEQDTGSDIVPIIDRLNAWLAEKSFGGIVSVERSFGGSKHPQVLVYGGGYNYFPEDEFIEYVIALPWLNPENVVLLVNPEDGPTRVFRPSY